MIQSKERVIDDKKYCITQLGWREGKTVLMRLFKILAPSVGSLVKGLNNVPGKDSLLDANISFDNVSDALNSLSSYLNDEDMTYFIETFAKKTMVTMPGGAIIKLGNQFQVDEGSMEAVFGGDYQALMRWLMFAIEVNYANFFTGAGGLNAFAQAMQKVAGSQSQNTSTGISTESQPVRNTNQV